GAIEAHFRKKGESYLVKWRTVNKLKIMCAGFLFAARLVIAEWNNLYTDILDAISWKPSRYAYVFQWLILTEWLKIMVIYKLAFINTRHGIDAFDRQVAVLIRRKNNDIPVRAQVPRNCNLLKVTHLVCRNPANMGYIRASKLFSPGKCPPTRIRGISPFDNQSEYAVSGMQVPSFVFLLPPSAISAR
uniref:hypothetical protein n=1 Tax=Arthrobacter luteolus TaxID=98672 RepID=UPI000B16243F